MNSNRLRVLWWSEPKVDGFAFYVPRISLGMVYQIFDDGIATTNYRASRPARVGEIKHARTSRTKAAETHADSYGFKLFILLIKTALLIYDLLTFPLYFLLQNPIRQARGAELIQSQQVDVNTWIRTSQRARGGPGDGRSSQGYKFMGATVGEIFARAVREYHSRACLGYRALITCPVFATNDLGKSELQDRSFRSDYTWYTYGQVGHRVQDIASGLYKHLIYPADRALFMASTCLEWFCVAQACFQLDVNLVLAPDVNEPSQTVALILSESHAVVLFVTCDQLDRLCELLLRVFPPADRTNVASSAREVNLRTVVLIDWPFSVDFNESIFAKLGQTLASCSCRETLAILSIGQIEEAGIENPIALRCSSSLSSDENPLCSQAHPGGSLSQEKFQSAAESSYLFSGAATRPLNRRHSIDGRECSGPAALPSGRSMGPKVATKGSLTTLAKPEDLAMIVYTSGALGQLRPIMVSHEQLARSNNRLFLDGMIDGRDVHCTISPLSSVIELMSELCVFGRGGSIGYSCNLQTLFYDGNELFQRDKSDLEALNPSYLLVKPYVLERLRVSIQNYQQSRVSPLVALIHKHVLYDYKKRWARRHFGTPIVDRLFCSRLRNLFGTRIRCILCNGATDCSGTKEFFAHMLGLPVIELHGPSEALVSLMSVNDSWDYKRRAMASIARRAPVKSGYGWRLFQFEVSGHLNEEDDNNDDDDDADDDDNDDGDRERDLVDYQDVQLMPPTINRNIYRKNLSRNLLMVSSILCPTSGTRIRLEDWEEFCVCDQPCPRGRLVIGGDLVCRGYFKRPGLSRESFFTDSNGVRWFRTDDIARVFPNGTFEIISAISDMIKMVDGQFISLSQVEHILRNSQFVDNVCAICGDDRTFVINLVVPNLRRLALKSPGEANLKQTNTCCLELEPEPEELIDVEFRREVCNDRLLSEFISNHLNEMLVKSGLAGVANRFLLVPEIWTPESELVTPAFQPKRDAIQKFYASDIQSIVGMSLCKSKPPSRVLARRPRAGRNNMSSPRDHKRSLGLSSGESISSVNSI